MPRKIHRSHRRDHTVISFLISLLIFILIAGVIAYICAWCLQKIPVVAEIGPTIVWAIFAICVLAFVAQHFGMLTTGLR